MNLGTTSVSLILGLATVLASGVVASIVTYRLNRDKDQTIFMRAKAEQLYLSADEYGHVLTSHILSYFPLFDGQIDYNQMLDIQIQSGSKESQHGGGQTMTMIVEIYFPSVRPALTDVWRARDNYNELTGRVKRHYQAHGHVTEPFWKPAFLEATKAIDEAIKALQKDIVAAARLYAGVNQN